MVIWGGVLVALGLGTLAGFIIGVRIEQQDEAERRERIYRRHREETTWRYPR